jgi:hypothetical protein
MARARVFFDTFRHRGADADWDQVAATFKWSAILSLAKIPSAVEANGLHPPELTANPEPSRR